MMLVRESLLLSINGIQSKKDNHTQQQFEALIRSEFQYLAYAPIIFVSAKTKQRLGQLPSLIKQINNNHTKRIQSSHLNEIIMDAIGMTPTPTIKTRKLRIYYATQVATAPPTIVLFVNEPELLHFSYRRYLENQIRKQIDFTGTPLRLIARKRK